MLDESGWPIEVEGAAAIRLHQCDRDHISIVMLRDDGRLMDEWGELTFARRSRRLEDRARDFECQKGWVVLHYGRESAEGQDLATMRITRLVDGALIVRANRSAGGYVALQSGGTWHRYEAMRDPRVEP